jgi:hypothetical protein
MTVITAHIKSSQFSPVVAGYRLPTADVPLPLGSRTLSASATSFPLFTTATLNHSQSQSYFATGSLPPITSSWRQDP